MDTRDELSCLSGLPAFGCSRAARLALTLEVRGGAGGPWCLGVELSVGGPGPSALVALVTVAPRRWGDAETVA